MSEMSYPGRLFAQLHGKELSYNNLLDIEAALGFISGFSEPSIAIIKHNNACGLASDDSLSEAWRKALAGDPLSAFGGVITSNKPVDRETAGEINKIFFEVIIAPDYDPEGLKMLMQKKNRIILKLNAQPVAQSSFRTLLDGVLWQEKDRYDVEGGAYNCVTMRAPADEV